MKKWMYILLGVVAVGVVLYYSVDINTNTGCPPPDKPKNVPQLAMWNGGCDGGNWIELVEIKEEKYRFRIYRDWDGELVMDADFEFDGNDCDLNENNWNSIICCYSQSLKEEVILLVKTSNEERSCQLKSIYPAYGGGHWKTIKEKYNL